MRKYNQKQARVTILKEMHDYIMNIDDEEAYFHWTIIGVPDEPTEEDYESIADDENAWEDIVKYFATLIKDYDEIDV